jgi:hypothetical protein
VTVTTGGPVSFRRWSGCNLHWRGPRSYNTRRFPHKPSRWARWKLYIPEDQLRYADGVDKRGPWVWTGTDCGWQWLATRPGIYGTRLSFPFHKLCDHVHTPHRSRFNVNLAVQRLLVRATRSRELDERLHTDVFPNSHTYRIRVTVDTPTEAQLVSVRTAFDEMSFDSRPVPWRSTKTWLEWDEPGSNSFTALRTAEARLREARGSFGGTSWANPVRIDKEQP